MPVPESPRKIPESDWRRYRALHPTLVDRYCQRALDDAAAVIGKTGDRPHDRYIRLWNLIQKRNKEQAHVFDAPRRSVLLEMLAAARSRGLFTEEEFSQFSPETRKRVTTYIAIMRGEDDT